MELSNRMVQARPVWEEAAAHVGEESVGVDYLCREHLDVFNVVKKSIRARRLVEGMLMQEETMHSFEVHKQTGAALHLKGPRHHI